MVSHNLRSSPKSGNYDTLGKIVKLLSYKTNGLEKFKIQPPRLNAKWLVSLLQQAFLICEANHYTVEFTRLA
jgi:hypothetical protein